MLRFINTVLLLLLLLLLLDGFENVVYIEMTNKKESLLNNKS